MQQKSKVSDSVSVLFYLICGLATGIILYVLQLYKIDSIYAHSFIIIYSTMFMLARAYTHRIARLAVTTIVPAFLSVTPLILHEGQFASVFFFPMAIISCYALNAFNIAFQKDGLRINYRSLFYAVWDSFVRITVASIFAWTVALVLVLWVVLFKLIGIDFFFHLFLQPWFISIFGSLFVALGFYLAITSERLTQSLLSLCLAFCYYLLPLLSIIGLLFVCGLIITSGIMGHTIKLDTAIFMQFALLGILFINGVYQDGEHPPRYRRWLLWVVNAFIIIAPAFPILSLFAIFDSSSGVFGFGSFVFVSLIALYTLSYAVFVVVGRKKWLRPLAICNIYLALLFIAVTIFFNLVPVHPAWFKHTQSEKKISSPTSDYKDHDKNFSLTIQKTRYHWLPKGKKTVGVVLGFSGENPLYLCKSKLQGHYYLGVAAKDGCHITLKDHIKIVANYTVLTGPESDIEWKAWNDSEADYYPVAFTRPKATQITYICRTIYHNKIYLGYATSGRNCMIEYSGKPISVDLLQYLYVFAK